MAAHEAVTLHARSRISRGAFAVLGCLFVGMGIIGVFVPIWPTTIFCILALWCFKKSSKKLEDWLLNNRLVGATLRDWEESKSMTLRAKWFAIGAIWLCISVSILLVHKSWVKIMLLGIAAALTWYLASRPTKVRQVEPDRLTQDPQEAAAS
jgi:uncharacterized membrane protein YbaN (DUF454 family)